MRRDMNTGVSRREWMGQAAGLAAGLWVGGGLGSGPVFGEAGRKVKVGLVFTRFHYRSHVHVILENFLRPYLFCGKLVEPQMDVVSMWGDQYLDDDMTVGVSKEFNIPIARNIEEALTLGGDKLACDAVLLIGEHGIYPYNSLEQHMYPRKQLFDEIVRTMKATNTFVPLFNDKHLSYRFDWAKEMYDTAKKYGIPFMAGSSVPMAHRKPDFVLPKDAEFEDVLLVHGGGPDSYDFHALEVLQSLMESRKGAETGVSSVQCLQGEAVWKAAEEKLWNPDLVEVALRPELGEKAKEWKTMSPSPYLILVRYKDGLTAPLVTVPGNRWAFACKVKGEAGPRGCQFHVGPWDNRNLFKALSHAIQEMFLTKKPSYPVERTLLTSGITEAVMKSRKAEGGIIPTPYLEFGYQPVDFSAFRENGKSWDILNYDVPQPPGIDPLGGIKLPS
ncbi:MAG: hypothetical protein KDA68_13965 [Planctomycetaceae bacterium]|nr:hypothetical protein [Planctomycetaceae bacterium]